jgi:hypothetical protein
MGDVNLVRGLGRVAGNSDGASRLACGGLGSRGCSREENERNRKGRGLEQGGVTSKVGTLADPAARVLSAGREPGTRPRTSTWARVRPA